MASRTTVRAFQVSVVIPRPIISQTFREWTLSLRDEEKAWLKKHQLAECLHLMSVSIDWGMLRAALSFWDPHLNLFRFQQVEISPSLEDISSLLELPLSTSIKFIHQQPGYFCLAEKLFGLTEANVRAMALDQDLLVDRERFQRRFMSIRPQSGCSEPCMLAYAFSLFEELFFPMGRRGFQLKLLLIFEAWKEGITLVPYILAELYVSLTANCRGHTDTLYGCVPYLQVWLWERLQLIRPPRSRHFRVFHLLETILKGHCLPYQRHTTHERNLERFSVLTSSNVTWHSTWINSDPYICSGRMQPLLLPHFADVIAYYPFRFLRLFGFVQDKPTIQVLQSAIWPHSRNNLRRAMDRVVEGWSNKKTASELSIQRSTTPCTTPEYDEWILAFPNRVPPNKEEIGKGKGQVEQPIDAVIAPPGSSSVAPSAVDKAAVTSPVEPSPPAKRPCFGYSGETDDPAHVTERLWEVLRKTEEHLREVSEGAEELEEALRESQNQHQRDKHRADQNLKRVIEQKTAQLEALKAQHAEESAAREARHQQALANEQRKYQMLLQQYHAALQELQQQREKVESIARIMGGHHPGTAP